MKPMSYNDRLLELYSSKLNDLTHLFEELNSSKNDADTNFSWPLLLRIWENEYEAAPIKLMIFGQETYGWDNHAEPKVEENTAETLTNEYLLHNMGRDRYRSPFWRTVHKLNLMLGNPDTNCFVWNNILKFGKEDSYGNPSDGVMAAEMKYLNVISEEVSILHPDVCVFLTGPNYDVDILRKFPNTEFIPVDGFKTNQLVQLKNEILPERSFRTYHPGYGVRHTEVYDYILKTIVSLSK